MKENNRNMSGETEQNISAWTVDSLHAHVDQRLRSQDEAFIKALTAYGTAVTVAAKKADDDIAFIKSHYDALLTERDVRYGQRFDAGKEALIASLAERDKATALALEERDKAMATAFNAHETAVKLALSSIRDYYDSVLSEREKRYADRFIAQEKAVTVALATVDKEFHEHIRAVREETRVALESADKAINKSESANEKRFESVNEFRAQQADMITTFARKDEFDARLRGITEKVETAISQNLQLAGSTLTRNEYDRAHIDLADKVIALEKTMSEKLEAQVKSLDQRISQLQSQISSIEAVTR